MIELIYPAAGILPTLPMVKVSNSHKTVKCTGEMFPVINEEGRVVAKATREYCHGGSYLLHPVVHLHLINRDCRIYLQKRSMKKDLMPGRWDTAVGGHVMYGESIYEALLREAAEELSLTAFNPIYLCSYTFDTGRDYELVNTFAAVGTYSPQPDLNEVDEGRWWSIEEIEKRGRKRLFTPNFISEFKMIKPQLLSLL